DVDVFNVFADRDWEAVQVRDGYRHRRTAIGPRLGAELLGATLYELDRGDAARPYHFELGAEGWLLGVSGRPTPRLPHGEQELVPGDVAVFPEGPAGAHKVTNRSDEVARFLIFSSKSSLAVVAYPDSRKLGIWTRAEGYIGLVRDEPKLDYWDGE